MAPIRRESQRQQVARQIEQKSRNLGNVRKRNANYFSFGTEDIKPTPTDNSDIELPDVIVWRKRWFTEQQANQYYTPNESNFITYLASGNSISTQLKSSYGGSLKDTQMLQYTNAVYDIEVYKTTATRLTVPLRCNKSVAVQVGNVTVLDSQDLPNTAENVTFDIPAKKWTKIEIYFYTHSSRVEDNFIIFSSALSRDVDRTRVPVPERPHTPYATQGTLADSVQISWEVRDKNSYSLYQVFYGTDASTQNNVLAAGIPGSIDPLVYNHTSIGDVTHRYYKVRGITSEGEPTEFTEAVEGWAAAAGDSFSDLTLTFLPNTSTELVGYYNESLVTGVVRSLGGELDYNDILVVAKDSNNTLATGTFVLATDVNEYYFSISNSTLISGLINVTALYSGGDVTTTMASGTYIYDNTKPRFQFIISADTYHQSDDMETWTRNQQVYLFTTSGYDPSNNGEDTAGIYQAKFAESIAGLSSAAWTDWLPNTPISFTMSAETGLKTIYGVARDRSGNAISNADAYSDSIYYATGHIQRVSVLPIISGYSFLDVRWSQPSRGDIAGYELIQIDGSSANPDDASSLAVQTRVLINSPTVTSHRIYWNGKDPNDTVLFPFSLGDLVQDTEYYYWLRAFTVDGQISDFWSASGLVGMLENTVPNDDVRLTGSTATGVTNGVIRVRFDSGSNPTPSGPEDGSAYQHDIYRLDLTAFPGEEDDPTNAVFIKSIPARDEDSLDRFWVYDTPPFGSHYYQYFTIAKNFWGYEQTGVTFQPAGTGLRLNDGPPSTPIWDSGNTYARWWGVRLQIQVPAESDIISYDIYTASGNHSGVSDPTTLGIANYNRLNFEYISANESVDPTHVILRESLLYPTGNNTFWAVAKDTDDFVSPYSSPLVTGIQIAIPPTPVWVSNESYSWFGYNNLVFSGSRYTEGILQGYKIYRNTTNTFSTSERIATILDNSNDGRKHKHEDHTLNYYTPYYYWVTAFNIFDQQSVESTSLYLSSGVEPDYNQFYGNYLDNSSMEREFDNDNNWTGTRSNASTAYRGQYYAKVDNSTPLFYSGYIFLQQNRSYYLSFYRYFNSTNNARTLSIAVDFWDADRENVLATSSFGPISSTDITKQEWARSGYGPFATYPGANSATLRFTSANTDDWNIDAVQWEEYSAGKSPAPYRDSRTISQDRMQAHIVNADMIIARSITAEKIAFDSISGGHIQVGSIELDKLTTIPGSRETTAQFGFDLITSGYHTIYVSGGTLNYGQSGEVNITGVYTAIGGATHVGRTFDANADNNSPYYAYYNNSTNSGELVFSNSLATVLADEENYLVWKFTNTTEVIEGTGVEENAGFFYFNGNYFGPGVQIAGNQITAGAIDGRIIQAGTIQADRIVAGGMLNLVKNGSFESVDDTVNSFVGLSAAGFAVSLAVPNWLFAESTTYYNKNPENYTGDTLRCGVVATGLNFETLYDTTQTIPRGMCVAFLRTPLAPDAFIQTTKFSLVSGVNYRLTFKYLISQSDNNNVPLYPGIMLYDMNGDPIEDGVPYISGGSVQANSTNNAPDVHYIGQIVGTSLNRDQWLTTGYDIRITTNQFRYAAVAFYLNGQAALPSPYYYIDEVQLKVGNYDTDFGDDTNEVDGFSIIADSIYTRHIAAEQITATEIAANAITAEKIIAGAVTAEKLVIKSDNLVRNGTFDRWNGSYRYRLNTTNYGAADTNLSDNWLCRLATSESIKYGYYQDTTNYKFGVSSLMISGLVISGSNAYLDTAPDKATGTRYIRLEGNQYYTFGYWIYKYPSSANFTFNSYVETYNSAGSSVGTHSNNITLTSAHEGTWTFVSTAFLPASTAYDARIVFDQPNAVYSPAVKVSIDGVAMVRGTEIHSGYYSEGSTYIDGDYIRVGTLDASVINVVTNQDSTQQRTKIDSTGITIGTAGGQRSELNSTDLKFYDENDNVFKYVKRLEFADGLIVNSSYTFEQPFIEPPSIILQPQILKTYNSAWSGRDQFLIMSPESITTDSFTPKVYLSTGFDITSNKYVASGQFTYKDFNISGYDVFETIIPGDTFYKNSYACYENTTNHNANAIRTSLLVAITSVDYVTSYLNTSYPGTPDIGDVYQVPIFVEMYYGGIHGSNFVVSGETSSESRKSMYLPFCYSGGGWDYIGQSVPFIQKFSHSVFNLSSYDWAVFLRTYTTLIEFGNPNLGTIIPNISYSHYGINAIQSSGTVSAIIMETA